MDKGFFGLALVVLGLVGVWALVTGKLKTLIAVGASTSLADSLNKNATTAAAPGKVQNGTFLPTLNANSATGGGFTPQQAADAIKNYSPPMVTIPTPTFSLPSLSNPTLGLTTLAPIP